MDAIPLKQIDPDDLVRDRTLQDEAEKASLTLSLRARGQQTSIETALPIERFAVIRAILTVLETGQDAYLTMIEENEIRANSSFYESADLAHRAVQDGVFPDIHAALRPLCASSTRSKRSSIRTFHSLVARFDAVL